jgi:hypothetical protein
VIQVQAKEGSGQSARNTYTEQILPALQAHEAYVESVLLVNGRQALLVVLLDGPCQDPIGFFENNQGPIIGDLMDGETNHTGWEVGSHHRA